MKNNSYCIYDILKFVLSLFIVQIHIGLFSTYSSSIDFIIKNLFGRYAVPLFFIISSFLLFKKINIENLWCDKNKRIFIKYFERLILLYIVFTIIYYLILNFVFEYKISIYDLIISFFTVGIYRQLWFIPALIYGVLLFLLLLNYISIKKILIISICLYSIGVIFGTYNNLFLEFFPSISYYSKNIGLYRNFLIFALPFISFGAMYATNNGCLLVKNKRSLLFKLLLFIICSILEFIFLYYIKCDYYALQIFTAIVSIYIFKFISNIRVNYTKKIQEFCLILRNNSIYIYFLHTLVYILLKHIMIKTNVVNNSIIMYILTILICIIISNIIFWIKNKDKKNN